MASCVIKDSPEYRGLKRMTGLDDGDLSLQIMAYEDTDGRFPEVDEIFGADSFPAMSEDLGLKEWRDGYYGDSSVLAPNGDARSTSAIVNRTYRDLETVITPIGDTCMVSVTRRPALDTFIEGGFDTDTSMSRMKNRQVLDTMAEKLDKVYGFDVRTFSNDDVPAELEGSGFDYATKNAFILDGNIWINTDNASIDAPLHEMMHMLLGELRFNDTELYNGIVGSLADTEGFRMARTGYLYDYAERDAMEEYFVTQAARRMAGMRSDIDRMPLKVRSKVDYDIKRMVDTLLMGTNTAKLLDMNELGAESILSLCQLLGSTIADNKAKFGGDMGFTHRIAMNMKRSLIQEGKLEEIC